MDWDIYLRSVLALAVVLALIVGAAWIARRLGYGAAVGGMRRRRRLGIVEVLPLDSRRRLVLVKKDGVEHLLLIGGGADLIVEQGVPPASDAPMGKDADR